MSQLICESVTVGYDGIAIVDDLSIVVPEGAYLTIVGENGSGKSTLMKAMLGLHPLFSGQIQLPSGLVGYLPQQSQAQKDFPASVEEIVRSGFQGRCGLRPFYTKKEKSKSKETMEKLGVLSLARRSYRELSGGQQQRVLLARALCATEKLLFLDEPVAGLDPEATAEMYRIIGQLHQEGITIVMISHDMAKSLVDATHVLQLGIYPFWGTKADYWAEGRWGK